MGFAVRMASVQESLEASLATCAAAQERATELQVIVQSVVAGWLSSSVYPLRSGVASHGA